MNTVGNPGFGEEVNHVVTTRHHDHVLQTGAQHLTNANAAQLASGRDNDVPIYWNQTRRNTYELQDIADIIPTHWQTWSMSG